MRALLQLRSPTFSAPEHDPVAKSAIPAASSPTITGIAFRGETPPTVTSEYRSTTT